MAADLLTDFPKPIFRGERGAGLESSSSAARIVAPQRNRGGIWAKYREFIQPSFSFGMGTFQRGPTLTVAHRIHVEVTP
jgi:hypothetical protein